MVTTRKQRRRYKFYHIKRNWKLDMLKMEREVAKYWGQVHRQIALNAVSSIPLGGKSLLDYGTEINE